MVSAMSCCGISLTLIVAMIACPLYFSFFPPQVADVKGKCAVVTGASSGIGVTIAERLAEEGVTKLAIAARQKDKLDEVAMRIRNKYPSTKVVPIKMDVSKAEDREAFLIKLFEEFEFCDILVNNAGVEGMAYFDKDMSAGIDRQLDINLKGLMHLTHLVLPSMIKAGTGHIVNMASMAGKSGSPFTAAYSASKHGVVGFTRALRAEMRYRKTGVTVGAICPGFISEVGMVAEDGIRLVGQTKYDNAVAIVGASTPMEVATATLNVVKYDEPEILVQRFGTTIGMAFIELFARTPDVVYRFLDPLNDYFEGLARARTP